MEEADATWAPESPNLSAYYSGPPQYIQPQHQGYRGSYSHAPPYSPPASSPSIQKHAIPMPRGVKKEEVMQDADYFPEGTEKSQGKRPEASNVTDAGEGSAASPNTAQIVIKNHFPVARIKRIMQADDDVGKVAQVTPVVVSKALELFMISLVTKAAAEAKARNSKRVAPIHLKQVLVRNEQFDFLSDIVSKVPDAPAATEKSGDAMDVDGKKRKAPARRKKKADEDDL